MFDTKAKYSSRLKPLRGLLAVALLWTSVVAVRGADALITGTPVGQILVGGDNRVMILSPAGEVLWQHPAGLVHDAWMLTNGNVLFADGESVTEVAPNHKVVFRYIPSVTQGGGVYSCQRLANGNTLVGENSTGKILELSLSNTVVFSLQTQPYKAGDHQNIRMARKLESGNYLVCQSGARVVKEYTPKGEVVWQSEQPGAVAFAAIRTQKGTTLVSSLDQIIEYDASGRQVWNCSTKDLAGVPVRNMTGMHLLPSGNVVVGCYAAYKDNEGSGLLEITPEKKVAWRFSNPKGDRSLMAVELLTADGKALEEHCKR